MIPALLKLLMGFVQNVFKKSGSSEKPSESVSEEKIKKPMESEVTKMEFSDKAKKLIYEFEGLDQPGEWPGESSGITIGIGYDLGYQANFEEDWKPYLKPEEIERLKTAIGKTGQEAKAMASQFSDIRIKRSDAEEVFESATLPEFIRETQEAFPGLDGLPLDAQGALVSLVYNRGPAMSGDRRTEMRAIRELVPQQDLQGIADQIYKMKRLWPNTRGLRRRRDAEAALVESCI